MNNHLSSVFQNILNQTAAKPRLVAKAGIHYNLTYRDGKLIGMEFTLIGLRELNRNERGVIEQAFFDHCLGDAFIFPAYTEPYEDFPPPEVEDEPFYELSDVQADKQHEDEKDKRWSGRHGLLYERGKYQQEEK